MFNNPNCTIKLTNKISIPCIGYGTYLTPDDEICVKGIVEAIKAGYRHIDTAQVYENEKSAGEGVRASTLKREEVFVTSKVWNTHHGFENTMKAFQSSLKNLKFDYVDLYLIHWPIAFNFRDSYPDSMLESYKALEKLYNDGLIRAIGVSNFLTHHLEVLLEHCTIKPMVNQIEGHIGYFQKDTVEYCQKRDIVVEAWSPVCKGRAFELEDVQKIAKTHNKTPAQVMIRWCLEHNMIPLPKSVDKDRIKENIDVFDFSLTEKEMAELDKITSVGRLGSHPDTCKF